MKTLLERQEDAYWQSVNKLKEADEILRDLDTTGWPWMVQQQLEKTRVQLMLTRQQITGGLVKSANAGTQRPGTQGAESANPDAQPGSLK